jgi:hypothetical protein
VGAGGVGGGAIGGGGGGAYSDATTDNTAGGGAVVVDWCAVPVDPASFAPAAMVQAVYLTFAAFAPRFQTYSTFINSQEFAAKRLEVRAYFPCMRVWVRGRVGVCVHVTLSVSG